MLANKIPCNPKPPRHSANAVGSINVLC